MKNILAQTETKCNTQLADGIHYDESIREHAVVVGGVIVNYATHWSTASYQFREATRARREHRLNCPEDSIPFMGEPVPYESEADDYGLEPAF